MDKASTKAGGASRRDFLRLAATGAPAAAVGAAVGSTAARADEEGAGEGLRMTDLARKYYETARF